MIENEQIKSDLVVSIVNYNAKNSILKCLESIYRHSGSLKLVVYVVDNNSSDDSATAIQAAYPQVHLICNKDNVGFARANNQVLRQIKCQYCLITNPDVVVNEGTLQAMVRFMDEYHQAGALGCKILNNDGSLQFSCRRYPTFVTLLIRGLGLDFIYPFKKLSDKYLMRDLPHDQTMHVNWLTGCCLMIRREALQDVGMMDESYFMYLEDVDFCFRINQKWKVYYFPGVSMYHGYKHQSRKFRTLRHKLYHLKSAIHFFRTNGPKMYNNTK
jgi:GT2 family glycosyltransferase